MTSRPISVTWRAMSSISDRSVAARTSGEERPNDKLHKQEPVEMRSLETTSEATHVRRRWPVERWLSRIDRTAAWVSALLLLLYLVSGFGMTKPGLVERATGGLVSWRVAYDMHNILHIPLIVVFAIHTITGIRRSLIRTTRSKRIAGLIAAPVGVVFAGYLLFLSLG